MKSTKLVPGLLLSFALIGGTALAQTDAQRLNTEGIARAFGKEGDLIGEMYKVSFPRSDVSVKVGNVAIKPALSLIAWAAFVKTGNSAVTYGDLVLLEDEVNPVISKLEEVDLELSALHNHLLHETPRVMYIHFVGRGDEVEMARGIREALGLTKSPIASAPSRPETQWLPGRRPDGIRRRVPPYPRCHIPVTSRLRATFRRKLSPTVPANRQALSLGQ
jgi:hypothetical protein